METTPDRIEKKIFLRAPRARVWKAISDSAQFGAWFGVDFDAPFAPGAKMRGTVVGSKVDEAVAAAQREHAKVPFEIVVETIAPERLFSFRWRPFAVDPTVDYSHEPMTLIEFTLEDAPGGTTLTVTESGFDGIPLERRAKAFTANSQGWSIVVTLVEKFLAAA